jgi:hypothetical protein
MILCRIPYINLENIQICTLSILDGQRATCEILNALFYSHLCTILDLICANGRTIELFQPRACQNFQQRLRKVPPSKFTCELSNILETSIAKLAKCTPYFGLHLNEVLRCFLLFM